MAILGLGPIALLQAQPQFTIVDLGVLAPGGNSQGLAISQNGQYTSGRDLNAANNFYQAMVWNNGAPSLQSNLPGRNFANAVGVNNSGVAVGVSTTTSFGSGALPMIWNGGVGAQLPLPSGQTTGRAYAINNGGDAVGSVNSGVNERPVIWAGGSSGTATVITATLGDGSFMRTAFGINNFGLVVGNGVNPNNAAVNVGLVYNTLTGTLSSVGALPGANGALAFGISDNGFVVGSSMLNQGSGTPYLWSAGSGMTAIPLVLGTSQGSARGVNNLGQVVGTMGGAFAVPFFYENGVSYRLQDLIPSGSGWDLSANTSAGAQGISADGIIVGQGVFNGTVHAFMMIPVVPEPSTWALLGTSGLAACWLRRRRLRR